MRVLSALEDVRRVKLLKCEQSDDARRAVQSSRRSSSAARQLHLLYGAAVSDRGVRNDTPLHEKLTAPPTPRLEPFLVEPEQVQIGGTGGPLAHFGQHVDEVGEFFRQLCEH